MEEAAPASSGLSFNEYRLQSQLAEHGDHFRMTGENSTMDYMSRLTDHFDAPGTTRIEGSYRGRPAIHSIDTEFGFNVFTTPEGGFWGAWRLSPDQIENVVLRGSLR